MGFWAGFLNQWNWEDQHQLQKDQISEKRKASLRSALTKRRTQSATERKKADEAARAVLWVQEMIPEGTENREAYLEGVIADPSVAIELRKRYDATAKAKGEQGLEFNPSAEEFMDLFRIVTSSPEVLEGTENLNDLQHKLEGDDLSKAGSADKYHRAIDAADEAEQNRPRSTVVQSPSTFVRPGKNFDVQQDIFKATIEDSYKKYAEFANVSIQNFRAVGRNDAADQATAQLARTAAMFEDFMKSGDAYTARQLIPQITKPDAGINPVAALNTQIQTNKYMKDFWDNPNNTLLRDFNEQQ